MVEWLAVFWTKTAKSNLKDIYEFYEPKSVQAAKNVVSDILNMAKDIKFPKQYQTDEIDERYRRMVVRHYKILYSCKKKTIYIHRIFDTRQDPEKLKGE